MRDTCGPSTGRTGTKAAVPPLDRQALHRKGSWSRREAGKLITQSSTVWCGRIIIIIIITDLGSPHLLWSYVLTWSRLQPHRATLLSASEDTSASEQRQQTQLSSGPEPEELHGHSEKCVGSGGGEWGRKNLETHWFSG